MLSMVQSKTGVTAPERADFTLEEARGLAICRSSTTQSSQTANKPSVVSAMNVTTPMPMPIFASVVMDEV